MNIKEARALIEEQDVVNGMFHFRTIKLSSARTYGQSQLFVPVTIETQQVKVAGTYGHGTKFRSVNMFVARALKIDASDGTWFVGTETFTLPINNYDVRGSVGQEVSWACKTLQHANYKADLKSRVMPVVLDANGNPDTYASKKRLVTQVLEALNLDPKTTGQVNDESYMGHSAGVEITLTLEQVAQLINNFYTGK